MKTKINRKSFLETLDKVKPGLSKQSIIEQSNTFVFKNNRVYTFNDEISVEAVLENDGTFPECSVFAEELYKLVDRIPTEELELLFEENELLIKTNSMKAGIRLDSSIVLPVEEIQNEKNVQSLPNDFFDGLRYCIPCARKDYNNPVLTCINVNQSGLIESCDNFRLMRYKTSTYGKKKMESFLLPASSAKQLLDYEKTLKKYGITPDKNWIRFSDENNNLKISCRTYLDASYPDLDPIVKKVDKDSNREVVKFPDGIKGVIERVSVFLSNDVLDSLIEVNLGKGFIEMKGEGQSGWCKEKCKIDYKSSPISFLINPNNFKEILEKMNECTIGDNTLHFSSENLDHVIWIKRVREEEE